ncbi:MAG: pyroglutamyl-peptidase I [Candidatus Heimdallarchaeota archaeon]|nr:pyroglutamyl-peptidase I [Candidatus Heimdallarchaeota archaeon]
MANDMKKALLTGFEPFGGDKVNPALEVMQLFKGEMLKGYCKACEEGQCNGGKDCENIEIVMVKLPVVFGEAIEKCTQAIAEYEPVLVLSIGQAGKREVISIEQVGINLNHGRIADNKGNRPKDELIDPSGPAAYFTTIDVRRTVEQIKEADIPVQISYSAGTYVCNNVIFGTLNYLHQKNLQEKIKYGFIHIPYLPSQAAKKNKPVASMGLPLVKRAIRIALDTNLE